MQIAGYSDEFLKRLYDDFPPPLPLRPSPVKESPVLAVPHTQPLPKPSLSSTEKVAKALADLSPLAPRTPERTVVRRTLKPRTSGQQNFIQELLMEKLPAERAEVYCSCKYQPESAAP